MKTAKIVLAGDEVTVGGIDTTHVFRDIGAMDENELRTTLVWHVLQLANYGGLPTDLMLWSRGELDIEGKSYSFSRRI